MVNSWQPTIFFHKLTVFSHVTIKLKLKESLQSFSAFSTVNHKILFSFFLNFGNEHVKSSNIPFHFQSYTCIVKKFRYKKPSPSSFHALKLLSLKLLI